MKIKYIPFIFFVLIFKLSHAQTGGETCATATVIPAIPYVAIGTTVGTLDDYFASCPDVGNPGGASDVVYEFTNGPDDIYVDIGVCQDVTDYDSQVYVYETTCTGSPVGCMEDGCQSPFFGAPYNSTIVAQLLRAGMTYYIVIDGYDGGVTRQLSIEYSRKCRTSGTGFYAPSLGHDHNWWS